MRGRGRASAAARLAWTGSARPAPPPAPRPDCTGRRTSPALSSRRRGPAVPPRAPPADPRVPVRRRRRGRAERARREGHPPPGRGPSSSTFFRTPSTSSSAGPRSCFGSSSRRGPGTHSQAVDERRRPPGAPAPTWARRRAPRKRLAASTHGKTANALSGAL